VDAPTGCASVLLVSCEPSAQRINRLFFLIRALYQIEPPYPRLPLPGQVEAVPAIHARGTISCTGQ